MEFIIKEWPDKSATLMTENGYNLATFNSLGEARQVYEEWRKSQQAREFKRQDAPMTDAIHL